jgi:ABC-type multidrug transport system ATPase subunit
LDKAVDLIEHKEKKAMKESVIEVKDFHKAYGKFVAVDKISFDVKQGEIFGLLGPNGAGKTSTLECLEGLRAPNGGLLRVAGMDPVRDSHKLRATAIGRTAGEHHAG